MTHIAAFWYLCSYVQRGALEVCTDAFTDTRTSIDRRWYYSRQEAHRQPLIDLLKDRNKMNTILPLLIFCNYT